MPDVLTRLAFLERAVAGIAGGGMAGENLTPNTYTVDKNGNVILSSGIILPAGTSTTPPTKDRVTWQRTSDGSVVADIFAYEVGGAANIAVNSYQDSPDTAAQAFVGVRSAAGAVLADLGVSNSGGTPMVGAAFNGGALQKFLDANGISIFAQTSNDLADLANLPAALLNLGVARGQSTVTFTASTVSAGTVVNHGLAGTPTAVIMSPVAGGGIGSPISMSATTYTNTQFTAFGRAPTSISATVTFAWVAVL